MAINISGRQFTRKDLVHQLILRQFPIHTLKVDQSLVHDIARNGNQGEPIVMAILSMAQALGLETVAEGVETCEQLGFLAARGCNFAQGFYYSKSVSAETLEKMLLAA